MGLAREEAAVNYLLALMTNGRREYLARTLDSLGHLRPAPSTCFIHNDAGETPYVDLLEATGWDWEVEDSPAPIGHCRSYDHVWQAAARSPLDWAFVVEDDQVVLRPVDLEALSAAMDATRRLVQMTLLRTPWGAEIPFGGYIPQTPGWYRRQALGEWQWIETTRNWACAPTLFRTSLTREVAWPLDAGCETSIGPTLLGREEEASFGIWGWGEPWVAHIGVERARGSRY